MASPPGAEAQRTIFGFLLYFVPSHVQTRIPGQSVPRVDCHKPAMYSEGRLRWVWNVKDIVGGKKRKVALSTGENKALSSQKSTCFSLWFTEKRLWKQWAWFCKSIFIDPFNLERWLSGAGAAWMVVWPQDAAQEKCFCKQINTLLPVWNSNLSALGKCLRTEQWK